MDYAPGSSPITESVMIVKVGAGIAQPDTFQFAVFKLGPQRP